MPFGALAGAIAAGRTKFRSTTPRGKGRRPRPISSGPKTGRRPRKLTTSEAAIRRFEQQKRGGTRGRPARPTGTGRGPQPSRPTRGPRRTSRTINTGSRGPQRTSRTSRTAIGRSRARIARRR